MSFGRMLRVELTLVLQFDPTIKFELDPTTVVEVALDPTTVVEVAL